MAILRNGGLIWSLLLLSSITTSSATEIFVAPEGRDDWTGTTAVRDAGRGTGPFATLERARDEIRKLRHPSGLKAPVTVSIQSGTYSQTQTFRLQAEDSGTKEFPITYRAAGAGNTRLVGGRILSQWTSVTNPEILARLSPEARKQVVTCNLRQAGISDLGKLSSRGFGRPTTPAHLEMFYRNRPMTLARWPNTGEWTQIHDFPKETAAGDDHGGNIGQLEAGFFFEGDRPLRWKASDDIWVHGYWAWDWANSYERVASLDPKTHLLKTVSPYGRYGFRKGQRYYFLNVLEELDQPGEYYVDRSRGEAFFWPPAPLSDGEVLASVIEQPLIEMQSVQHVNFEGLVLEGTRGEGIVMRDGAHNKISGCLLRLIGSQGISVSGGTQHQILGCDVRDCGDGGVSISGGDRQTLTPGKHLVENCHFERIGRWSKCYVPAVNVSGVGHRVAHNLIHDHPHCAIQFVGNEHVIEFNEIHHVAMETGDVGVIYTGRDWTYRGHQIRHNFIHHIGGVGMGSMGVYMDDCTSSAEIIGNIFYQSPRAVLIGGGRDYLVKNNIFVDCSPAIHFDARGLSKAPVWSDMVQKYMKQRLDDMPQEFYRQRYPRIADLDPYYARQEGIPPEHNQLVNNLCVGGKWIATWNTKPDWLVQQGNHIGADPGFVSQARNRPADFLLKPDAAPLKQGFEQIPVDRIGLQPDSRRAALPRLASK